jgi:hypothetical protein
MLPGEPTTIPSSTSKSDFLESFGKTRRSFGPLSELRPVATNFPTATIGTPSPGVPSTSWSFGGRDGGEFFQHGAGKILGRDMKNDTGQIAQSTLLVDEAPASRPRDSQIGQASCQRTNSGRIWLGSHPDVLLLDL